MLTEQATPRDIPALLALIESAYRGDSARRGWSHEADLLGGQRTDHEELSEMISDPRQHLLVHRAEVGFDACIAATEKGAGLVYIGVVTVAPDQQGRGLGKAMLQAIERFASDELGAARAEMTVIAQRTELIAWYERRGYRLTGERRPFPLDDPRFGEPKRQDLEFVVMEKPLSSSSSQVSQ